MASREAIAARRAVAMQRINEQAARIGELVGTDLSRAGEFKPKDKDLRHVTDLEYTVRVLDAVLSGGIRSEHEELAGVKLCGVVQPEAGPNGEPAACAYESGHTGGHSWSWIPTFGRDYSSMSAQIDRLARGIMKDFPHEPGRLGTSEGAVDTTLRLLERLKSLEPAHEVETGALKSTGFDPAADKLTDFTVEEATRDDSEALTGASGQTGEDKAQAGQVQEGAAGTAKAEGAQKRAGGGGTRKAGK